MADLTLLDIAKLTGTDKVVGLIEENLTYAPELKVFPARQVKGTSYMTVKRTAFPAVGFRQANAGVTPGKSTFAKQLVELFILSAAVELDKAVAEAYEDGSASLEMLEASGVMKQALIWLGAQIWYGTGNDALGFAGIKSLVPKGGAQAIDATGTTATTASSIYACKFGTQDVQVVTGNNATFELTPFRDQQITDANSKKYWARVADLLAWVGLAVNNVNCVGRILNLTQDSGKGLTDTLIAQLLEKFPVGYQPDYFFMSRRSARQLQVSRSVTIMANRTANAGGNVQTIADWPTSAFNIPIVITDSIGNTDAIE